MASDEPVEPPVPEEPPAAFEPPVASLEELFDSEEPSLDFASSLELAPEALSSLLVLALVDVVGVVVVEVVSVASFSAAELLGGVISGVVLGVTSETLVPPHELRPTTDSASTALAASAAVPRR